MLELRPEVAAFAQVMERKLRLNDAAKGTTWKTDDPNDLMDCVYQEMLEVEEVFHRFANEPTAVVHRELEEELADVANFLFMIGDNLKAEIV